MKFDNNTIGLFCITCIVLLAIGMRVEGAKELALALGGAIGGWMAKEKTV